MTTHPWLLVLLSPTTLAAPLCMWLATQDSPSKSSGKTTESATGRVPPKTNDQKALAERVGKAHGSSTAGSIDRYTARITIKPLGKGKDTVDIELEVKYGLRIKRAKDAVAEMIRYTTKEGDKPLERGRDPMPWSRIGDEVKSLSDRHDETSLEELRSHTRLCRQMLKFLDPGAILAGLEGAGPVQVRKLRVARDKSIETDFISGRLDNFPLFRQSEKKAVQQKVQASVWVARDTGRLAAVEVYPLDAKGQPIKSQGEYIVLGDYGNDKGVLVPRELLIYATMDGELLQPQVRVSLSFFELNARLTRSDFMRPR